MRYDGDPADLVDVAGLVEELTRRRPKWMASASCAGLTELFFPNRGDDVRPAKAICAGCPVAAECAAFAVDAGPLLVGVWAGTSDRGRRQLRRMSPTGDRAA